MGPRTYTAAQTRAMLAGKNLMTPTVTAHGVVERPVTPSTMAGADATTVKASATTASTVGVANMVQIYYPLTSTTYQFCAGVAVTPTKILTAGTCVAGLDYVSNEGAMVFQCSANNVSPVPCGDSDDGGFGYSIAAQWVAPGYAVSAGVAKNDLALLTAGGRISATLNVATSADDVDYEAGFDTNLSVTGWGTLSSNGTDAWGDAEQAAPTTVESDSSCQQSFSGYDASTMGCAGTPSDASAEPEVCSSSPGDPVMDTVTSTIIGIATGAGSCVGVAGEIFTKLAPFYGPVMDQIDGSNLSDGFDSGGALMAEDSVGSLWSYASNGSGGLYGRQPYPISTENTVTLYTQHDPQRTGEGGDLARTSSGHLIATYVDALENRGLSYLDIGGGWNVYNAIVGMGDVGGAQAPDVVARDASGVLWLYLGYGNGRFAPRTRIGGGWNEYTKIVGDGDVTGDGYADLIARDSAGNLWLYQGTGNWRAPFEARVQIGHGYQIYDRLAVVDDYAGDGLSALVARDSAGDLWLYRSTGKVGASLLTARTQIGHGWNIYTQLF